MAQATNETLGQRFKAMRERQGLRQDDVAVAARNLGLPWTSATIAAIELDRREVSLDEFVVLRGRPIGDEELQNVFAWAARPNWGVRRDGRRHVVITAGLSEDVSAGLGAEVKAARRLGVEPNTLSVAARRLWGRGLSEERDRLVQNRATADMSPRTVQALRGHITRELLNQLGDALSVKKKARKK
jgi:hypothetical protein